MYQAKPAMLESFRKFTASKFGIATAMGFLILIALAFAAADVTSGNFGGVAGGDRVAMVGKKRITTSALSRAATSAVENLKEENPKLSMSAFLASGGLADVLSQMLDRAAIGVFGEKHGMIAGQRLVDSEIAKVPSFRGLDGRFSDDAYRQVLQQRGLTDELVRDDLSQGLIAKQVLIPASFGAVFPQGPAQQYAALLKEKRTGAIALIPSAAFAPKTQPTDAELAAYYGKISTRFIRPERRVIRYAVFDGTALKNVPAPTEAEIAARYNQNRAQYAASESRKVTQLVVPTEAAAKAILAEVAKGSPLDRAAANKGLSTSAIGPVTRQQLTSQASPAVADAVFAAAKGAIAGPAKSGIGWHLMRVDAVEAKPARSLDQVRAELTTQIAAEKQRAAISDLSARLEEELDSGSTLADVTKELTLTAAQTEPLTADGQVYGKPGVAAPPVLARVIQTAFAMERENEAQLAEVEAGKTFVIFDVVQIAASAPAPLADVKAQVATAFLLEKGAAGARAAADKVLAAARKGTPLSAAMASLGQPLPPVDQIDMGREQLVQQGQQVPPPLALLFSMAKGTVKLLPAPDNRGWFVVSLSNIVPGQVAANDPLLFQARRELGSMLAREYADELRRAIRAEVGVTRNEAGIKAVQTQLAGGN